MDTYKIHISSSSGWGATFWGKSTAFYSCFKTALYLLLKIIFFNIISRKPFLVRTIISMAESPLYMGHTADIFDKIEKQKRLSALLKPNQSVRIITSIKIWQWNNRLLKIVYEAAGSNKHIFETIYSSGNTHVEKKLLP